MENEDFVVNLEQDLTEIAGLIWGYMDKKYISQMKRQLDGYRQSCEENLSKEAQLLRSVIPFMPEESKMIQMIVDAIIYNDMIERGLEEHQELGRLYRDENKDKENLKKLVYKLVLFKLVTAIEKGGMEA